MKLLPSALCVLLLSIGAPALREEALAARDDYRPPPTVIAVIEGGGFNPLHRDFARGRSAGRFPGEAPPMHEISLPSRGPFAERLEVAEKGPLGHMKLGRLYHLRGTRVAVYAAPDADSNDLLVDREHATGTLSAAAGLRHGTDPEAMLVYVRASQSAWRWLARQKGWIDLVSASYYPVVDSAGRCYPTPFVKQIARQGRIVFASAGNFEQAGLVSSPSGTPEAYQVGGVDDQGRSYVAPQNASFSGITPTRPYETGDRFNFPAADFDSLRGSQPFGGTSGATPSTAGRAAQILAYARSVLHSSSNGVRHGALATLGPGGTLPSRGPLSDGDLTATELMGLLHHTAVPAEPEGPLRYLVEGYGALSQHSVELAEAILSGRAEEPARAQEDEQHERVEDLRAALSAATDCNG